MAPGRRLTNPLACFEGSPYLFVSEPELVLQDRLPVGQDLDFIGEGVERINQRLCEMYVIHPTVCDFAIGACGMWHEGAEGRL